MQPGDLVDDRFEVQCLAGSGGMGDVYRAKDRLTGEAVAVKVLHVARALHGPRFTQEALVLAELEHPGILCYVAHGIMAAEDPYLVTEWLEGESLAERLNRQALTIAETVTLGLGVARALAAAHQKGILHRDLKPSNLFLVGGQVSAVKILDFGIARRTEGPRFTLTGAIVGTPGYMAPEQARGSRDIDVRVDVFSLGCVLFKCLTGRQPFAGKHMLAVMMKILLDEVPRARELNAAVPEALDGLVIRMLAKAPENRPGDAAAVAEELEGLGEIAEVDPASSTQMPAGSGSFELTKTERRVMCLVLARDPRPAPSSEAPTMPWHPETYVPSVSISTVDEDGMSVEHPPLSSQPGLATSLHAEVERHRGDLQFLADGSLVVALSRSGTAIDLAAQAAQCALAIRTLLPNVAMAVVAGRAVPSAPLSVADLIDRGVDLLGTVGSSAIRVDEVIRSLLDARFDIVEHAAQALLVGERDTLDAARTLLGKPTACVGRARDIETLEAILAECVSEPVARAALVTAAAGIGKSRVREELVRRILTRRGSSGPDGPQDEGLEIWIGRGDPLSAGSSFALLGRVLRAACGLQDGEPLDARRRKVASRAARHVGEENRERVAEFLGELLGTPFPDEGRVQLQTARRDAMLMGDQMRRAGEDFLMAECAAHPVLIVLEDLHWGDLPTVKFIDAALRHLRDLPLMVLALGRPEVHELFPKMWVERGVQEIRLGELTRRASELLVRQVLGESVKAETVALLVAQAHGNAFYLEELIRVVAEGKGTGLPETVLAMVQARLDGLEPDARRVLRAASVFGQAFWKEGVSALVGGARDREAVDTWLAALAADEVITRRVYGRFPAQEEYVFRHALLREAAYASLTESDRVLGHRLAGKWLLGMGEGDAMVLAEHFERGEEPAQAVRWYRRAVEHALEGNDLDAVVQRADRGAACGAQGEDLGALRLLQAEAHRWRGQPADSERRGADAMLSLPPGSRLWYLATSEAMMAATALGNTDRSLRYVDAMRAERGSDEVRSARGIALARAVTRVVIAGRHELAESLFAQIAEIEWAGAGEGTLEFAARAHSARAWQALATGDPGAYLRLSEASAACYERAGDQRNACAEHGNVGYAYLELGAFTEARQTIEGGLVMAERLGLRPVIASARNNLGLIYAYLGDIEAGRITELEAVNAFKSQGNTRMEAGSRAYLGRILILAGDLEGAEREARAAAGALVSMPPMHAQALAVLADVLLARERVGEALEAAAEAAKLLASLGTIHEGEALIRLSHARALHAAGDERALPAIAEAQGCLLTRAAKLQEPALRASFLEQVPENARTLALAAQWLPDGGATQD